MNYIVTAYADDVIVSGQMKPDIDEIEKIFLRHGLSLAKQKCKYNDEEDGMVFVG